MSEAPFPVEPASRPHRRLGYLMAAAAATLWGVNGTVSKIILASGVSSLRLTEVRCAGAFAGLAVILAVRAPQRMRVRAKEVPFLALFGIGGLAFVQWFYFLSIHRVPIGIALLVQYLAPLLVALWARFVYHDTVRRRIWVALGLALAGLALIVNVFGGGASLSTAGIAFALGGALAYAFYVLLAEHAISGRDAVSLLGYGFAFASLFWAVVAPWWSFSWGILGETTSLGGHLDSVQAPVWALVAWMVVLGTMIPFFLLVSALRHITATRAGIVAMLEPVVGALVGWIWLAEGLDDVQLAGAAVVLAAIALAQTAR